eukprot:GHVU01215430.1.p1 GENE.GHVU01215430.1~~GHVU01215430.1.p1  ORF type:complete len:298 (-),score=16.64 GHVU01215430.1:189-1082(-)
MGVAGISYLLFDTISTLSNEKHKGLPVETIAYAVIVVMLSSGTISVAFAGCLLLPGAMATSNRLHAIFTSESKFFGVLFIVWSVIAVVYKSSSIGFISVVALMATLGFSSSIVNPASAMLGFSRKEQIGRWASVAFCVLHLVVAGKMLESEGLFPALTVVFEREAILLSSIVGYTGLLVSSSKHYYSFFKLAGSPAANSEEHIGFPHYMMSFNYLFRQFVSLSAGIWSLLVGSSFHIPLLQKVGGTFTAIFILVKMLEFPADSLRDYAWRGVLMSALIYVCLWAVRYIPALQIYFFV